MRRGHAKGKAYVIGMLLILTGSLGIILYLMTGGSGQMWVPPEMETLSFALYGDSETLRTAEEVAEAFSKQADCRVDVYCYSSKTELEDNILGQIAAGDAFDVFIADWPLLLPLAEKGELAVLDDVLTDRNREGEQFYEAAVINGQTEGIQYALPTGIMPYMLYYNQSMLEELGIEDPQNRFSSDEWTFADFCLFLEEVHEKTGRLSTVFLDDYQTVCPLLLSNGGEKVTDDLGRLLQRGVIELGEAEDCVFLQEKFSAGDIPIMAGDLTMTKVCSGTDFVWDVVPFPSPESDYSNSCFSVQMMSVGNGRKTDMAKEFANFYVSTLGQKIRLEAGECLIPSMSMVFYTSMGGVVFPKHSNGYFFTIENGYSINAPWISGEERDGMMKLWETITEQD